jgi:hypothetical protein
MQQQQSITRPGPADQNHRLTERSTKGEGEKPAAEEEDADDDEEEDDDLCC